MRFNNWVALILGARALKSLHTKILTDLLWTNSVFVYNLTYYPITRHHFDGTVESATIYAINSYPLFKEVYRKQMG